MSTYVNEGTGLAYFEPAEIPQLDLPVCARTPVFLPPMFVAELQAAADGLTVPESAYDRFVSEHTAKNERKRLLSRLGAQTSAHTVRLGFELGYLLPDESISLSLTDKQVEELWLASHGFSTAESATARGVSLYTVRNQRRSLLRNCRATSIAHAVRKGFDAGVLVPEDSALVAPATRLQLKQTADSTIPDEAAVRALDMLSLGASPKETQSYLRSSGVKGRSVMGRLLDELGASNYPHAVRLGFDRELLTLRTIDNGDVALAPRQQSVVEAYANGLTAEDLAERLGIAIRTVRNHQKIVLAKLGAVSGAHAVRIGFERNLLRSPEELERAS